MRLGGPLLRGHVREVGVFFALSVLACTLLAMRAAWTGSPRLLFLPWNLFLAWIPFGIALITQHLATVIPPGRGRLLVPTGLWLLFLPNAPYILTDLIHLRWSPMHLITVDMGVILVFAAIALALGLRSLAIMQHLVETRISRPAAWTFVGVVLLLSGLGVWMGRVVRLNSWDVFTDPLEAARQVLAAVDTPRELLGALAFTGAFTLALFVLYLGPRHIARERSR